MAMQKSEYQSVRDAFDQVMEKYVAPATRELILATVDDAVNDGITDTVVPGGAAWEANVSFTYPEGDFSGFNGVADYACEELADLLDGGEAVTVSVTGPDGTNVVIETASYPKRADSTATVAVSEPETSP